jgi:DNA-binding transcriptional LysR family regulator
MAAVTMEWESRFGRRLRVRDLYILSTVVGAGGMAKAARQLSMSQPAVSSAIANLEHLLGVRLLDRGARGVEPTIYAEVILKRSAAVFDELKQSVRDVEFLSDPTIGEVGLQCHDTVAATILPHIIRRFSAKYPRVVVHIDSVASATMALPALRSRECDLVIGGLHIPIGDEDLSVETLFDDQLVIAAGQHNRLARRRKIDLAELIDEPWILQAPYTWNYLGLKEAFQAKALAMPKACLVTLSTPLISEFLANGPYITAYRRSVTLHRSLKVLPVDLPARAWPLAIVVLKNRTLSPVVERFIESVREVAKLPVEKPRFRKTGST